jgi:hypothetical protein
MELHYIIIGIVIAIIVILQVQFFLETWEKLEVFENIFPYSDKSYKRRDEIVEEIENANEFKMNDFLCTNSMNVSQYLKKDGFDSQKAKSDLIAIYSNYEISSSHRNPVLDNIFHSINNYLVKNRGAVSDFHLMKDIVERNCDSKEEEINAQIPVPLYLGLVGTMAGILIGILYLWLSGGLNDLLTTGTTSGAKGVEALLGGVALAMISSICGILLTTWGSNNAKKSKVIVEKNKNTFLSWIQSELLPNLSNDVSGALTQMTKNLTRFNNAFSTNTQELRTTLESVNESYKNQAEILKAINKLKISEIATANIEIYDKLKNCTAEIGDLGGYLENVRTYLNDVHQSIADVGTYFRKEIAQIEERKGVISRLVGELDNHLQTAVNSLKENADTQIRELKTATVIHTDALKTAIQEQRDALNNKLKETSVIIDELKNLTAVRTSMDNLVKATNSQNLKIDNLVHSISELAQMKTGRTGFFIPQWVKILAISGFSIISLSCLIFLAKELIKIIDKFFPILI